MLYTVRMKIEWYCILQKRKKEGNSNGGALKKVLILLD